MIEYCDLNAEFLHNWFPELCSEIDNEAEWSGDLPHCLFGNILNPLVVSLIKNEEYDKNKLLEKIFDMYEQMAKYGDDEVKNLLQVTLLEYLWDDYVVYTLSLKMMGDHTLLINQDIAAYLHIPKIGN